MRFLLRRISYTAGSYYRIIMCFSLLAYNPIIISTAAACNDGPECLRALAVEERGYDLLAGDKGDVSGADALTAAVPTSAPAVHAMELDLVEGVLVAATNGRPTAIAGFHNLSPEAQTMLVTNLLALIHRSNEHYEQHPGAFDVVTIINIARFFRGLIATAPSQFDRSRFTTWLNLAVEFAPNIIGLKGPTQVLPSLEDIAGSIENAATSI